MQHYVALYAMLLLATANPYTLLIQYLDEKCCVHYHFKTLVKQLELNPRYLKSLWAAGRDLRLRDGPWGALQPPRCL